MKQKTRMIIDTAMVTLLPLLMAYALIGEELHEWLGTTMFLMFVFHHILNFSWLKSIIKGKYNAKRTLMLIMNLLLLVVMILLPVSGIMMSKHVFRFLNITVGASFARTVHLATSYWGLVLMCIHLGFHVDAMMHKMFKKRSDNKKVANRKLIGTFIGYICLATILLYGIYAVWKRQILSYMFMKIQFVFFDYSESLWGFMVDYISIMFLLVMVGYWTMKLLDKMQKAKKET